MSDINVTPLVDVMLVLVVIFILTAPLLVSSIPLELPKTQSTQTSQTPVFITLAVNKDGQVFFNDKPVSPEELAQQLAKTATQNAQTEVQLRADTTVAYGRVVAIMDAAQKAGLNRIGFIAQFTCFSGAPE